MGCNKYGVVKNIFSPEIKSQSGTNPKNLNADNPLQADDTT
jgi:hypothetical protein